MPLNRTRLAALFVALPVILYAGCQESTGPDAQLTHDHAFSASPRLGPGLIDDELAREVRQATARFSSTTQATKAGYAESSPCVASPAGGMGFHWAANGRIDPDLDLLQPEVVLYEPQSNGQLRLVAIEYIVIDVGQPAPTFGGEPFNVGGTPVPIPHWSLHVWLFKENPNGMFTPFNPAVSCP